MSDLAAKVPTFTPSGYHASPGPMEKAIMNAKDLAEAQRILADGPDVPVA